MRIIPASVAIESPVDGWEMVKAIERAGRTCYKSEEKITDDSAQRFVQMVLKRGHHSVIEHESVSVRFICDRGVTHETVRHRLASYSQESTRYCNYSKAKFGQEITVIDIGPHCTTTKGFEIWLAHMSACETAYLGMLDAGESPQIARSCLPNSLKTEIVMTCNLREWRHFFSLRTAKAAHPQMREVARALLEEFRTRIPVLFDDVGVTDSDEEATRCQW